MSYSESESCSDQDSTTVPAFLVTFADDPERIDRLTVTVQLESNHHGYELERYMKDRNELQLALKNACTTFLDKRTVKDHNMGELGQCDSWDRLRDLAGSLAASQLYAMGHIDPRAEVRIHPSLVTFNGKRRDGSLLYEMSDDHEHMRPNVPSVGSTYDGTKTIRGKPEYDVFLEDSQVADHLMLVFVQSSHDTNDRHQQGKEWDTYAQQYLESYLQCRTASWSKSKIIEASQMNDIHPRQELKEQIEDDIEELLEQHLKGYECATISVDASGVSFKTDNLPCANEPPDLEADCYEPVFDDESAFADDERESEDIFLLEPYCRD